MEKEIYIVISRCKLIKDWTGTRVSQECYDDIYKAIEFCESRLNSEELEYNRNMQKRKLRNWYEFDSEDYAYEIKVLSVV